MKRLSVLGLLLLLFISISLAHSPHNLPIVQNTNTPEHKETVDSPDDIRVWVNTDSGVYHCPGSEWYGKTKHGKYMTQKKAQKKGYRPAGDTPCV